MRNERPLIAVVDDEESIRKAIERLLRSAGMDVVTFSSGERFITDFGGLQLDCVVLDLHMPDITGFEVQADLVAAKVPVIVITGHDTAKSRARVLDAGAAAYLPKPVSELELLSAIDMAIAGASA